MRPIESASFASAPRVVLGLLVALFGGALGGAAEASGERFWEGFSVRDLAGREWAGEDLEGKVVLIDFWATWCAPCLAELPHLARAYERFRGDGFVILGVSVDQIPRRELLSWLRRQAVSWPQLWDGRGFSGDLPERFAVSYLPRSLLVDREGRVVASDLRGEALEVVVESLLGSSSKAALTGLDGDE
jgi:thiol-disulfide isomerase/thioredoxin